MDYYESHRFVFPSDGDIGRAGTKQDRRDIERPKTTGNPGAKFLIAEHLMNPNMLFPVVHSDIFPGLRLWRYGPKNGVEFEEMARHKFLA